MYARHAVSSGMAEIAAVAEPDPRRRAAAARLYPRARLYADWQELAANQPALDAVIIATQDRDHVEPALRFAELGHAILLEKPMAVRAEDCVRIIDAVEAAGVTMAVCHVLRYMPATAVVKHLVDSGRIGEIVTVQHLEPVGWWHQAHSFVRGNWRRTADSTFMLLAKSCHDLDWLSYIIGQRVERVSSFGGLSHFRPENRPAGATERCLTCPVEPDCAYSAPRIYLPLIGDPDGERWPLGVLTADTTREGVIKALADGPYGRCVYSCDNDVVDHQVVNLEYEGGITAAFTMTAFTPFAPRSTRIMGTRGYLTVEGGRIEVYDFRTAVATSIEVPGAVTETASHDPGDRGVVEAFLTAIANDDPAVILSSPRDSLEGHLVAWAAERARLTGSVVSLSEEYTRARLTPG